MELNPVFYYAIQPMNLFNTDESQPQSIQQSHFTLLQVLVLSSITHLLGLLLVVFLIILLYHI